MAFIAIGIHLQQIRAFLITCMLNSFFQNNRQTPPATGNRATTLQAILMMTSGLVTERIKGTKGSLVEQLSESTKSNDEIIEELYMTTLSRVPTSEEKQFVAENVDLVKNRRAGLENLQWILMNRAEFLLNH